MKNGVYKILSSKKNIIVGYGKEEQALLLFLSTMGIYVDFLCSDNGRNDIRILNKKIVSFDIIKDHFDEYNAIVCSSTECQNSKKKADLLEKGIRTPLFTAELGIFFYETSFKADVVERIIDEARNLKIIVFGINQKTIEFCQLLDMLDIQISYFIEDEEKTSYTLDNVCRYKIDVNSIYRVLDEETGSFRIFSADSSCFYKLELLGLREGLDFADIDHDYRGKSNPKVLDPILGYNWVSESSDIPGFVLYGAKDAKFRIATLGGSTSDSMFDPYFSWPKLLYKKLKENINDICIYSGGCEAYKSAQEMLKFIRDVIPMKPDLVIDYSGYNDAFCSETVDKDLKDYPFYNYFQVELIRNIAKYSTSPVEGHSLRVKGGYVLGNLTDEHRSVAYFRHISIMHEIAEFFGIKYICFLQPSLIKKKERWGKSEKELFAHSTKKPEYFKTIEQFYHELEDKFNDYFVDATHIFDDSERVFFDDIHATMKGNQIISNYIASFIMKGIEK